MIPGKRNSHCISIFIVLLFLIYSCGKKEPENRPEKILAKVSNKTISVNEFIRRAEYTPRPPYCNGNTYVHKKIVLNSLLAEKMMALEAGENNEFITTPKMQEYLRGRKEQVMREYLYIDKAYEPVQLDTSLLKKVVVNSTKKYKISYINVNNDSLARQINDEIRIEQKSLEDIFSERSSLKTIPQREVSWENHEYDSIVDSLFLTRRNKNDILGPIKVDAGQYLFVHILDWENEIMMTNEQLQERWNDVKKRLTEKEAKHNFKKYVHKVMEGKTLEFTRGTFLRLVNIVGPLYLKTAKEQRDQFQRNYWGQKNDDVSLHDFKSQVKNMANETLFTIAGEVWSVERFFKELQSHPLVFRKKKMKNKEFAKQLQLAIGDLVRDLYLNKEAYKAGYDKLNAVQRDVAMWKDNLNHLYYKAKYLKSLGDTTTFGENFKLVIDKYLNPLVDSLQKKYSDVVEINMDEFKKIQLTKIDMSVIQQNVPFAKMVPGFPLVTTDFRMNYGKKMARNQ